IKLSSGSTTINGTNITQSGTTGITASFAIPSSVSDGTKFDLTITNTSGDYVTRTQAVTIYNAMTVTSFTPLSASTGTTVNLTVTGTGFKNGYTKVILKNAANESITITPSTTSVSATQIAGTFTAPSSSGTWKVYVSAYNGGPEYAAASNLNITASTGNEDDVVITFPVRSKNGVQNTGMLIIQKMTFKESVLISAQQHNSFAPADSHVRELKHTNIGVLIEAQGKQPEKEIELRIPYNESDITEVEEELLVISRYDEERQVWVPLKSKVDKVNQYVISNLNHLSVFAIMGTGIAGNAVGNVKYYPNPMKPSKGMNYARMHFSNLPAGTRIKIYTLLGQIVRNLEADASGMAVWDGNNENGKKASSGTYIAYIEDNKGNKKRIKIAVER
ncbi:MAG: T9SS type A sorting domain-containing protein, partial [Endomicrobia bacterium]|nr:T9SS type A sorting domain-containing protein [Endomicrobiia bacterium]